MSAFFFYTLSYTLMSGCIIYPPTEFVSAGLTIKSIFSNWLGSENEFFTQYHIRRSAITLFIHSVLPFGYISGLIVFGYVDTVTILGHANLWLMFLICATIIPLYTLSKILMWSMNNWAKHPIARNLAVYCNNNNDYNNRTWTAIASDINIEYRSVDKIIIATNSVTSIIVTDNWIIKVMPYGIIVAHQSDTALIVNKSDTHDMSPVTRGEVQFINIQSLFIKDTSKTHNLYIFRIYSHCGDGTGFKKLEKDRKMPRMYLKYQLLVIEVKPTRTGAESFDIRLDALDFKNLQDKISRPIVILQNITFHKTLLERFIDNFKEQVQENPFYECSEELGQCIGCMQATSNVKLFKQCSSVGTGNPDDCTICCCRPIWCIDCMAKWFASRQDENAPEAWLSSKCTCPVCRSKFCILDVCLVQSV